MFVLGNQTFAIRTINSVQTITIPPSNGGFTFLLLVGLFLCVLVMAHWLFLVSGAVLTGCAIWGFIKSKPTYALEIITNSGQQRVLVHREYAVIAQIVQALHEAIAMN